MGEGEKSRILPTLGSFSVGTGMGGDVGGKGGEFTLGMGLCHCQSMSTVLCCAAQLYAAVVEWRGAVVSVECGPLQQQLVVVVVVVVVL